MAEFDTTAADRYPRAEMMRVVVGRAILDPFRDAERLGVVIKFCGLPSESRWNICGDVVLGRALGGHAWGEAGGHGRYR